MNIEIELFTLKPFFQKIKVNSMSIANVFELTKSYNFNNLPQHEPNDTFVELGALLVC